MLSLSQELDSGTINDLAQLTPIDLRLWGLGSSGTQNSVKDFSKSWRRPRQLQVFQVLQTVRLAC